MNKKYALLIFIFLLFCSATTYVIERNISKMKLEESAKWIARHLGQYSMQSSIEEISHHTEQNHQHTINTDLWYRLQPEDNQSANIIIASKKKIFGKQIVILGDLSIRWVQSPENK